MMEAINQLREMDVFFLIGVAHGPYLDGLTELPIELLAVAKKISASIGDDAMVTRCDELSAQLLSSRTPPTIGAI